MSTLIDAVCDKVRAALESEWQALGSAPVRPDAASGASLREDPAFERLQSEMRKLDAMSTQAIDWNGAVAAATDMLRTKSKDFVVASYLVRALFEQDRYAGLVHGLECLAALSKQHWETGYPVAARMRARVGAFAWLDEKLSVAVKQRPPRPEEMENLKNALRQLAVLRDVMRERLQGEAPGFVNLQEALAEQQPGQPEPAPAPSTIPTPGAAGAYAAPPPRALSSLSDCTALLEEASGALRRAAHAARTFDPTLAWPYRLLRAMTWRQIEEAPAARDEHQTNIPPPPPHLAERFDGLARQGSWVELVHQVETQVPEYPFWLDLHQWTALGLKTLGPTYANAHAAVCGEVRTLLQRCPELAESRFNDGTPMANEATAGWIGSTVLVSTGGASADSIGTRAAKATEEGQRAAWVTQAQSAMVGGDVQEGLRLFTEAIERTKGEHARFQLKVQLVKACVASRQESLAAAFLEELDAQIREHRLEQWQPDLVKDVLTLWWQVLKAGNDRSAQSRMQDIAVDVYRRLCRLDPISAVQLDAQGREGLLKRFRMA